MSDTSLLDLSEVASGIENNASMFIRHNFDLLTKIKPLAQLGQAGNLLDYRGLWILNSKNFNFYLENHGFWYYFRAKKGTPF